MPDSGSRPAGKAPEAFRTIREVSEEIGVPQHILRFWETRFPQLKPLQRGGNRRYYRPADVALAGALHSLLHGQGYTVKGVQKLMAEHGPTGLVRLALRETETAEAAPAGPLAGGALIPPASREAGLRQIRDRLAAALAA